MIIVTGAAGFIGSCLIKHLNQKGFQNILAIDNLSNGHKYQNLVDAKIADYQDYQDFLTFIQAHKTFPDSIEAIFHQGACSNTMEWDGQWMMQVNYDYSKTLFHYCTQHKIPFIYASSAAVYGKNNSFNDQAPQQKPLNIYGYSKWLFDQYVLRHLPHIQSPVVGLRYFNVYGPGEQHKGKMASVAWHFMNQLKQDNKLKLFQGCNGYKDGEQLRDFIYVIDVAKINLWFLNQGATKNGIYNVGTGEARSFNELAQHLIKLHGSGSIEYIPFPEHLKAAYQSFTEADLSSLRKAGYSESFTSLKNGLEQYYEWFNIQ
jgi:ADP-L-glycero-D-manno-heptose 6-epimerase